METNELRATLDVQERKERALDIVRSELDRAMAMHPTFNSKHEGYAVIKEELDELWDAVKRTKTATDPKQNGPLRQEATQIAAMAIRFLIDLKL